MANYKLSIFSDARPNTWQWTNDRGDTYGCEVQKRTSNYLMLVMYEGGFVRRVRMYQNGMKATDENRVHLVDILFHGGRNTRQRS